MRMAEQLDQCRADLLGWQDEVHEPGADGTLRHAGEARRFGILDDDDAALGLDEAQAERAVGAGPRQDDGEGPLALVGGQRAKERVDRMAVPTRRRRLGRPDDPRLDRQLLVGCDHVYLVRFEPDLLLDLPDRHGCASVQQIGQMAHMGRVEMGHDHEGSTAVGGHGTQQRLQRLEAAGGRADRHDGKSCHVITPAFARESAGAGAALRGLPCLRQLRRRRQPEPDRASTPGAAPARPRSDGSAGPIVALTVEPPRLSTVRSRDYRRPPGRGMLRRRRG